MAPASARALGLDLVRGLCALGIAAYHFIYWTYGFDLQSLATFGVYVFFVLSALAMMIRYAPEFASGVAPASAFAFYVNRAARILPLLLLMAAVAYVYLEYRSGGQSLGKAFLTGTGLFALHMPGALSNTPGAWSLGIELAFYAVFPMICLLGSGVRLGTLALTFAALLAGQQVLLAVLPDPSDPAFWGQYSMPITFAPFFCAGVLIYRMGHTEWRHAWVGALLCLAVIFGFTLLSPGDVMEGGSGFLFLSALTFAAVLLAYRSELPPWLHRLAWFLGEISYSAYLSHWLVYELAVKVPGPWQPLIFAIGVIAAATLINRFFERPTRDYIRTRLVRH